MYTNKQSMFEINDINMNNLDIIYIDVKLNHNQVTFPVSNTCLKIININDLTKINDNRFVLTSKNNQNLLVAYLVTKIDESTLLYNMSFLELLKYFKIFSDNDIIIDSIKIRSIVSMFIYKMFSDSNWKSLASYRDFSSYVIQKRCWPYFNSFSESWRLINEKIRNENYPEELTDMESISKDIYDQCLPNIKYLIGLDTNLQKKILANKIHNYKYIKIVEPMNYESIDEILIIMNLLYDLKMYNMILGYTFVKCINHNSAHIIKSPKFWEIINKTRDKFIQSTENSPNNSTKIYELLLSYITYFSFYIIHQEEFVSFNDWYENFRILYDINEAHNILDFSDVNFENHPLVHIIPGTNYKAKMLPYYVGMKNRKINNFEKFKKRFNWATRNALKNIDLLEYKAIVTGSILIPCVATNPLEERFVTSTIFDYLSEYEIDKLEKDKCNNQKYNITKKNTAQQISEWKSDLIIDRINNGYVEKDRFMNYIECYYPSYRSLLPLDYNNTILHSPYHQSDYESIKKKDLEKKINYVNYKSFKCSLDKKNQVNSDTERNNNENSVDKSDTECNNNENEADKSDTEHNNNENRVDKSDTERNNNENEDDEKCEQVKPGFNLLSDIDISIHAKNRNEFKVLVYKLFEKIRDNVKHYGSIWIVKKETKSSFKYEIYGPGLIRPIDIFYPGRSPEKMIKSYHLGAVRMFYDGKNVKLFHSCVATLLTGINLHYKWMSCNKIPGDIILKYAQKGYSTVLNNIETKAIIAYIKHDLRWNKCLDENDNIMGMCKINNKFFYPDHFNAGFRMNLNPQKKWGENNIVYNNSNERLSPPILKYGEIPTLSTINITSNSIAIPSIKTLLYILNLL